MEHINEVELVDYIVAQVSDKVGTPCWIWNGTINNKGYGRKTIKKNCKGVHQWMYLKKFGDPGPGMVLDHKCRVRICCNPDHLEAITNEENIRRGNAGRNQPPLGTHCKRGHLRSRENSYVQTRDNGKEYLYCRECQMERYQKQRQDPAFIAHRQSEEYKAARREHARKKRNDPEYKAANVARVQKCRALKKQREQQIQQPEQ